MKAENYVRINEPDPEKFAAIKKDYEERTARALEAERRRKLEWEERACIAPGIYAYNMDCKDYMQLVNRHAERISAFPELPFDLAIVDPPYFEGPNKAAAWGGAMKKSDYSRLVNWELPDDEYWDLLFNFSEDQIVWGINHFDINPGPGRIFWDKMNSHTAFSDGEIAYCSFHKTTRLFRYMWNGMQQGKNIKEGHIQQGNKKLNERRIHQTQKPVLLYLWLYQQYWKPGMSVVDTHLGSGTHMIAAYYAGVERFVGIEKDPVMFRKSIEYFNWYIKKFPKELIFEL